MAVIICGSKPSLSQEELFAESKLNLNIKVKDNNTSFTAFTFNWCGIFNVLFFLLRYQLMLYYRKVFKRAFG